MVRFFSILLCLFLYVPAFSEDMTYWIVDYEGNQVQITEKQSKRIEAKEEIKRYYVPFFLGIAGVVSLTPIGMGLGMYLIFTASGN